jgi:hypothetical protein
MEHVDAFIDWCGKHWRKMAYSFTAGFLLATGLIGCAS